MREPINMTRSQSNSGQECPEHGRTAGISARRSLRALLLLPLLAAAGCANLGGEPEARYQLPSTRAIQQARAEEPAPVATPWWSRANDPLLEELARDAATSNQTLRAASARLRAALHGVEDIRYSRWPSLQPRGGVVAAKDSELTSRSGGENQDNGSSTTYDAGVDAAWELDVWGRSSAALAAALADAEQGRATVADLQWRLRVEVARSYIRLREAQSRAAIARLAVSNQTDSLRLAEAGRDAGRGMELDVLRAGALVAASEADTPLWQEVALREAHLLAVLSGRAPRELEDRLREPRPLPDWGSPGPPAEPGPVLARRPDLLASGQAVLAAFARARVSRAEILPSLRLLGDAGVEAEEAGDLSDSRAVAWSAGLRLRWPGLDSLRLRARAAAAGERAEAAIADHEQRVLDALREVENALSRGARARLRLGHLERALTLSDRIRELVRVRYRDGLTDFLPVIDAERENLRLREQVESARTETAQAAVDLFAAFGSDW